MKPPLDRSGGGRKGVEVRIEKRKQQVNRIKENMAGGIGECEGEVGSVFKVCCDPSATFTMEGSFIAHDENTDSGDDNGCFGKLGICAG